MQSNRVHEIERNYTAFLAAVAELAKEHEGEFALISDRVIVSVHANLIDAVIAGQASFSSGMYSIQEVTTVPLDLGFYSHANPSGKIC